MPTCKQCGAEMNEGVKFCMNCGAPLETAPETPASPAVCPACGAPAAEGEKFCRACGAPIAKAPEAPAEEKAEAPAEAPKAPEAPAAAAGAAVGAAGYQPPQGGYQPPQGGYQPPQGGYQPPQGGYQPPQGGYQPPQGGYQPQPGAYQQPYAQQPAKKKHTGLFIGLGVGAVVIIGIIVAVVLLIKAAVAKVNEELQNELGDLGGISRIIDDPDLPTVGGETNELEPSLNGEVTNMIQAGVKFDLKDGVTVPYTTHNDDGSVIYVGNLTVDEVIFQELSEGAKEFADDNDMDVDGYVHVKVHFTAAFPAVDSDEKGVSVLPVSLDYYNTSAAWDGHYTFTDSEGDTCHVIPATVDGEEKEIYFWRFSDFSDENGEVVYTAGWDILMPEGYDGFVLGYTDASSDYADTDATFLESYQAGVTFHLLRVK